MIAAVADTPTKVAHPPTPSRSWFSARHSTRNRERELADPQHVFTEAVFTSAIVQAMRQVSRAEVPDMPDRMVAATALYFDVPVISRDGRIRAASLKTLW